jgi:hypothetical protein
LYTQVVASGESDDIERWFEKEFESPAEEAIQKAVSNVKLAATDWHKLVRFLAAQDVRTPARLMATLGHWHKTLPALVEATLAESVQELEAAKRDGTPLPQGHHPLGEIFPGRVTVESSPQQGGGRLRFETVVGRGLWLFGLKFLLTETVSALLEHRWTILRSPPGIQWLTSDDPVIRLNYLNEDKYDFGGGWGSKGTEIFLPLSPHHLLYTRIGEKPPPRGHVVSWVEHAHRFVFGQTSTANVIAWRPRIVDSSAFVAEANQWRDWHANQSNAERGLVGTAQEK